MTRYLATTPAMPSSDRSTAGPCSVPTSATRSRRYYGWFTTNWIT